MGAFKKLGSAVRNFSSGVKTIRDEAAYHKLLKAQTKERQAFNSAMRGGAKGGLSGQAASYQATNFPKPDYSRPGAKKKLVVR